MTECVPDRNSDNSGITHQKSTEMNSEGPSQPSTRPHPLNDDDLSELTKREILFWSRKLKLTPSELFTLSEEELDKQLTALNMEEQDDSEHQTRIKRWQYLVAMKHELLQEQQDRLKGGGAACSQLLGDVDPEVTEESYYSDYEYDTDQSQYSHVQLDPTPPPPPRQSSFYAPDQMGLTFVGVPFDSYGPHATHPPSDFGDDYQNTLGLSRECRRRVPSPSFDFDRDNSLGFQGERPRAARADDSFRPNAAMASTPIRGACGNTPTFRNFSDYWLEYSDSGSKEKSLSISVDAYDNRSGEVRALSRTCCRPNATYGLQDGNATYNAGARAADATYNAGAGAANATYVCPGGAANATYTRSPSRSGRSASRPANATYVASGGANATCDPNASYNIARRAPPPRRTAACPRRDGSYVAQNAAANATRVCPTPAAGANATYVASGGAANATCDLNDSYSIPRRAPLRRSTPTCPQGDGSYVAPSQAANATYVSSGSSANATCDPNQSYSIPRRAPLRRSTPIYPQGDGSYTTTSNGNRTFSATVPGGVANATYCAADGTFTADATYNATFQTAPGSDGSYEVARRAPLPRSTQRCPQGDGSYTTSARASNSDAYLSATAGACGAVAAAPMTSFRSPRGQMYTPDSGCPSNATFQTTCPTTGRQCGGEDVPTEMTFSRGRSASQRHKRSNSTPVNIRHDDSGFNSEKSTSIPEEYENDK